MVSWDIISWKPYPVSHSNVGTWDARVEYLSRDTMLCVQFDLCILIIMCCLNRIIFIAPFTQTNRGTNIQSLQRYAVSERMMSKE